MAVPRAGCGDKLSVLFTDTSTGVITNCHWTFGDGTTLDTTSTSVSNIFNSVGTCTVVLKVSAPDGSSASATGMVKVTYATGVSLTWTGAQSDQWDLTTANWFNGAQAALFAQLDDVNFDDNSARTSVSLSIVATPNRLTFNNSSAHYTLSGSGRISGSTGLPNRHFPNMKALTDYIRSQGFKAGIYSSPGPHTCCGFTGSWQHEEQDAACFAA